MHLGVAAALRVSGYGDTFSDFFAICRYVLKNLVRDWSAEGAAEREESYGRISGQAL